MTWYRINKYVIVKKKNSFLKRYHEIRKKTVFNKLFKNMVSEKNHKLDGKHNTS